MEKKHNKWLILAGVAISIFMATLDGSIVNIALPVMSKTLNVTISSIQWVVTSYLLTISVLLLIWGRLADIFGRKRFFIAGYIVFTLGSLLCGLSPNLLFLVISRVIQGIGAACTMALSQGIVTTAFPPNERGRALGITGTTVAIGSLMGPSLGGILVKAFGWQSIFYINIPIGIVAIIFAYIVIPKSTERQASASFDLLGSGVFVVSISMLFTSLLLFQDRIIPTWLFIALFICSILLIVYFLRLQIKNNDPLIDLSLFKNKIFSLGLSTAYLTFIALNATILFLPFYLQSLRQFSPFTAGLIISAYPITSAVVSPISGWLSDKISYRPLTIIGLLSSCIMILVTSTFDINTSIVEIAIVMSFMGASTAIFQSPNNSSVMGSVPRKSLGVAGGISALFRNLGMVSGTTFSVMLFTFTSNLNIDKLSGSTEKLNSSMFLTGFRAVMIFAAISIFIGFLLSSFRAFKVNPPQNDAAS